MSKFPQVFQQTFPIRLCINLKDRTDRWEQTKKEFEKVHLEVQRIDAVKHDNPVIGCFTSHIKALKIGLEQKSNVFIFEDDVEFLHDINVISIATTNLIHRDWSMFYLGANILRPFFQVDKYLARLTHAQSTHAYGVSYSLIPDLINFLEKNNTGHNIDVLYADYVVPNQKAYISIPMIAIQREDYSDILKQNISYDVPMRRYENYLQKGSERGYAN